MFMLMNEKTVAKSQNLIQGVISKSALIRIDGIMSFPRGDFSKIFLQTCIANICSANISVKNAMKFFRFPNEIQYS